MGKYVSYIDPYILAVLTSGLITACNNDIFTDVSDLPDITDVTIKGEGGEWSAPFSRKGLTQIHIHFIYDKREYVRYYNKKGNEINSDCPASELGSIVYENPRTWYSVSFSGDMIYISSHYNASDDADFSIRFDYESGDTKYINIHITEGGELSVVSWTAKDELKLEEDFGQSTYVKSFTNNGSIAQKFELTPFLDSKCSDIAMPADKWACGLSVDIPMLMYNDNEWSFAEYKDIALGSRREFTPRYWDKKIVVDVPPYKKAKVSYKLNYTRATQNGTITLNNNITEQCFEVPVTWTSVYATSYEYKVEYE